MGSDIISVNDPNFAIYKKRNDGQFIPFNKTAKDMTAERQKEEFEILKDPDYIQAKRKAMDEYYTKKKLDESKKKHKP